MTQLTISTPKPLAPAARRFALLWLVVALLFQGFVTQTHGHPGVDRAWAASESARAAPVTVDGRKNIPAAPACPLCEERALFGAYLLGGSVTIAAPVAGLVGGLCGGLFSRAFLMLRGPEGRWRETLGRRPLLTALVCGLVVAVIGVFGGGTTWGTGYEPTTALLEGAHGSYGFGPAKFLAVLATSVSGMPGGIFSPSLAVGAGVGNLLTPLFPTAQSGAIVLLGMAGYFVGVVRAPLTAVIILSETTGSSGAILPLFAAALIGDWAGAPVCRERLYHGLALGFLPKESEK